MNTEISILLLGNASDESLLVALQDVLAPSYKIKSVCSWPDFEREVVHGTYRLLLVNEQLSWADDLEAVFAIFKQSGQWAIAYGELLEGTRVVQLLQWGADECVELAVLNSPAAADFLQLRCQKVKKQLQQDFVVDWHYKVLQTVSYATKQLHEAQDLLAALENVLPHLGQTMGAGRVYIFEHHAGTMGHPGYISQRYEWIAGRELLTVAIDDPDWQEVDLSEGVYQQWSDLMKARQPIFGSVEDFSAVEQQFINDVIESQSIILLPIFIRDEWWGVLGLDLWEKLHHWSLEEVEGLQAVANVIGTAIGNDLTLQQEREQLRIAKQISAVLKRQTSELAGLYEISTSITGVMEPRELLERLFRQLQHLMDPDTIIMVLYDDELLEVEIIVAREHGRQLATIPVGMRLPLAEAGLTGWMIQNKKTILIGDMEVEGSPHPIRRVSAQPRSWLGTPLWVNGRVVGAISIQSYTPNVFDRNDIRFVESVATQAAVAINGARLYQKEMHRRQISESLHSLTAQLSNSLGTLSTLTKAIDVIRAILPDVSICTISTYDPEIDAIIPQAMWSEREEYVYVTLGEPTKLDKTQFAQKCIWEKRIIQINDLSQVQYTNDRTAAIANNGLRAFLYLPLLLEGEAIGLFTIDFFDTPRYFLPEEIALCEAATHHVVVAMKNARMYESETKRRREAELLHELTAYLVETIDVDQIFVKAIALLKGYLSKVSHCRFLVTDHSGEYLIPTQSWRDSQIPQPLFRTQPIKISETFATKQCLNEKKPIIITDLKTITEQNQRALEFFDSGMRSLLYVPLLSNEQVVGMLQVDVWDEPYQFSEEEIAMCQAVANHVAIGIERSELVALQSEQLQLSNTLREVGSLLTSRLKPEEIFERIFDLLARVIPYNTVSVQLFDAKRNNMILAAGRGFRDLESAAKVVGELGLRVLLLMADKPFRIIKDTEQSAEWIPVRDFEPIRSTISCALRIKDRLIGVLNIDSFLPNTYDEKMAETAMAFANQAVVAIENSRLYEQLNQRALELAVLNQIAVLGAAVGTLDELFEVTTETITHSLFQHNFGFLLIDESRQYLTLHPSYFNRGDLPLPKRVSMNESLSGQVIKTNKPFMGTVVQNPQYFPIDEKTKSELIVPLSVNGAVIGVINVEDDKPNAFSERDLNFLDTLTGQLSVAIQRVQLYEDSQFYAAELEDKVTLRTLELQQEKDRMSAILDSVGEGVIFTDADGLIQYANPALYTQSGYSAAELSGRPSFMLSSSQENDPSIFDAIRSNASRRERWRGELVNVRKDGSLYEVIATITPVLSQYNDLAGFVTIQSDITHFKEVERLKSEFVSNVSHELRTPLTNIKTFLTLLKRGRPEKRERYQDILEREADRLARLIQDLLDLSRLDTNSVKTKLKPVALDQIMAESTQSFQAKAEAKEIHMEMVTMDTLPLALADSDQIHQVAANLLGNAIAYTPERGQIVITLQAADFEGRPMVTMAVADSGIGILEEEREKLFDRFYRGHAAHQSRSPGTGLGLAISKEIIERHNGRIEVVSQPNLGTTITVWLPIAE